MTLDPFGDLDLPHDLDLRHDLDHLGDLDLLDDLDLLVEFGSSGTPGILGTAILPDSAMVWVSVLLARRSS